VWPRRGLPARARLGAATLVVPCAILAILVGSGALASGTGDLGKPVIAVDLRMLGGRQIELPQHGLPGVLIFATSTCAFCVRAAQALNAVRARLGSRIDALMIDLDWRERAADLSAWSSVVGHPHYPLAIAANDHLAAAYRIEGLGTTIIYNARGRIVARDANPGVREIEEGLRKAGVRI
jgi:thiol-disulfide isomerase/thioredoxin